MGNRDPRPSRRRRLPVPVLAGLAAAWLLLGAPLGPSAASSLLAVVDTGELYASGDQGTSWSAVSSIPMSDAACLLATDAPEELVLATRSGIIHRSHDGGLTWSAAGSLPVSDVADAVGLTDGAILVLTRTGSVWISKDGGISFTTAAALPSSDFVSLARNDQGELLALCATGLLYRSTDGGSTWAAAASLPLSDGVAVRALESMWYAMSATGWVYRSLDGGGTWSAVGTTSQVGMVSLAACEGDLVAVHRTGMAARSLDGAVWSWVGTLNQVEVVAVANDVPQTIGVPERPGPADGLALTPPWPNPVAAGSATRLAFTLGEPASVGFALFDVRGRRMAARAEEEYAGGASRITWELPRLASGLYLVRMEAAGQGARTTRLVILD